MVKQQRYKANDELSLATLFPKKGKRCRYCGLPLTGRRTSWCSTKCAEKAMDVSFFMKGYSTTIRKCVFKRDKGICNYCYADCSKIDRVHRAISSSLSFYEADYIKRQEQSLQDSLPLNEKIKIINTAHKAWRVHVLDLWKGTVYQDFYRTSWEADHIIEIYNNGQHKMDNLQTLCIICHRKKTRAFMLKR